MARKPSFTKCLPRFTLGKHELAVSAALLGALASGRAAPQGGGWVEAAEFDVSGAEWHDRNGSSVDLDGTTAVAGNGGWPLGSARVYERSSSGDWQASAVLSSQVQYEEFAGSVSISGDVIAVGAARAPRKGSQARGAIYVFERRGDMPGSWKQTAVLEPEDPDLADSLGVSVAIDGELIVAGASNNSFGPGAAHVFERRSREDWQEVARLTSSNVVTANSFGFSVAVEGSTILVGSPLGVSSSGPSTGVVHVFERDTDLSTTWSEVAELVPLNGEPSGDFGWSVALYEDRALVGAPRVGSAGAVYAFDRLSTFGWSQSGELQAPGLTPGGSFGQSIDVLGDVAVVGDPRYGALGLQEGGTAHVFVRSNTTPAGWTWSDELVNSDPAQYDGYGFAVAVSGATAVIGVPSKDLGFLTGAPGGLGFDPVSGVLYAADPSGMLLVVDTATGVAVPVGPLGASDIDALAYDPGGAKLYGAIPSTKGLVSIDPATGATVVVGTMFGSARVRGLAFDAGTGTLYGADEFTNRLVRIDTASALATSIGDIGYTGVEGLAWDAVSSRLLAIAPPATLIEIDPATGAGSAVASVATPPSVTGLAFNPSSGDLYAVGGDLGELHRVDPWTGNTVSLGYFLVPEVGAVYAYELPPSNYCTAGTSASGCMSQLTSEGSPSASAEAGFTLRATGVEAPTKGVFFFGANGRQATAWGNGTSFLCVQPPVIRGEFMEGPGQPGTCTAAFAQDLNAYWCSGCPRPRVNPGPGVFVQAQFWYRDPLNTSGQAASLSDALEFVVGP